MIERLHPQRSGARTARRRSPRSRRAEGAPVPPAPLPPPPRAYGEGAGSILGFPAEFDPDVDPDVDREVEAGVEPATEFEPEPDTDRRGATTNGSAPTSVGQVVHRRADVVAGSALVLAGAAANVSLWLPWVAGDSATGMSLVRRGLSGGPEVGEVLSTGLWQPVAIVFAGGVLVILAMPLLVPAQTHRLVGVLALLVALTAAAGVGSLLAGAGWSTVRFDPGMWCGVAVAALGLIGALKAMLTLPRVAPAKDGEA